jgi:hypothetical protein
MRKEKLLFSKTDLISLGFSSMIEEKLLFSKSGFAFYDKRDAIVLENWAFLL